MKNFIALIFLIMGSALNAQIISVQGNVKSANDGEPLIGVNVVVQGDAVGTITDFDGNYTLNAPLNGTLVFSYIGYDDQVIMASGSFTQGSSIELSCDGPIREPYIAYLQGGLTYESAKLAVCSAVDNMLGDN